MSIFMKRKFPPIRKNALTKAITFIQYVHANDIHSCKLKANSAQIPHL